MDGLDLFAAYNQERAGQSVEAEPGKGFATWRLLFDPSKVSALAQAGQPRDVYIVDIYVARDFRRDGVGTDLARRIEERAKALGATRTLGTVDVRALTASDMTKSMLGAGFKITHLEGQTIWFMREIA